MTPKRRIRTLPRVVPPCLAALAALALACGEQAPAPAPGASEPAAETPAPAGPNLVLITMDTTRADALTPYGQPLPTSPNVAELARDGVLFEQVAASHPETLPSHSTIFTGKLPFTHGVRSNTGYVLSQGNVTLAEVLARSGWVTGAEVAAPVLRKETQVTQGFAHYTGAETPGVTLKVVKYTRGKIREDTRQQRIGADITSNGIEFIRRNRERKFFLWLHYFDPHNPYSPPAPFAAQFIDQPYHGEVASADFQIGRFLAELERLGLRESTLVVLTADHGEGLGEHGEPSHSYFVYEATLRVPLVFTGLGLPAGVRIPSLVRTADVAPTILDLLGLPPLEAVQGVSLAPLLRGEASDLGLTSYGEATRFKATFGMPTLRAVRHGRWKYIHKVNPELFDVENDPQELVNLADTHPDVAEEMRERLESMLAEAPPGPSDAQAAVDARTAAQLVALGYVAKSPSFEIGDELADLELQGADPAQRIDDIQSVTTLTGLLKREEYEAALELIEGLLERNPGSTYVLENRAEALAGLGRHREAVEILRAVREREPGNREAAYSLARSLRQDGRGDEAADLMNALLADDPCDERVRIDQNELLRSLGRFAELVGVLEDGAERCPDMLANLNNLAWALATLPDAHLRDGPRALATIRSVIERADEPNPAYLDTLSAALAETGDFEAAVRASNRVLEELRAANLPEEILLQVQAHRDAYLEGRPVREPAG